MNISGDEIGCYVERIDPNEYWIRLTLNGRNLGWSQAIRTDEEVYPTICFQRGPIQIDVRWPDDQSMQDSKPQFVAVCIGGSYCFARYCCLFFSFCPRIHKKSCFSFYFFFLFFFLFCSVRTYIKIFFFHAKK